MWGIYCGINSTLYMILHTIMIINVCVFISIVAIYFFKILVCILTITYTTFANQ